MRGRETSRRSADIVREIGELALRGVREVTLLGQNVNSYGLTSPDEPDFATLLRRVAEIPGIDRIRFTTSHPKDISPPLIACFGEIPEICGHIHLPAQSGSDRVLARMNRGYNRAAYLEKIAALKEARPGIQFTGDFILGFPGETDEDFQDTLSLQREAGYADLFMFKYSSRPGTGAAGFDDDVPEPVKQERLTTLLERQREMTRENNRRFVGSVQRILVEGVNRRRTQMYGRTDGNRIVNFVGSSGDIGSFRDVVITRAYQNSLLGEVRAAEPSDPA